MTNGKIVLLLIAAIIFGFLISKLSRRIRIKGIKNLFNTNSDTATSTSTNIRQMREGGITEGVSPIASRNLAIINPRIVTTNNCEDIYNRCISNNGSVANCTKLKNSCYGQSPSDLTAACYLAVTGNAQWGSTLYDSQWKKCFSSLRNY